MEFADLTGLLREGQPRRYLWTDAFAVCNFLELHRQTGDEEFRHLALRLVDQVHHVLGRHREDDKRSGWISGLSEEEALRLVTINPAIQLGVDRIVGSLEAGKQGDIAIFSEHPMSAYTRCDMTIIEGRVYFDRDLVVKEREEAAKKAAAPKATGGVS